MTSNVRGKAAGSGQEAESCLAAWPGLRPHRGAQAGARAKCRGWVRSRAVVLNCVRDGSRPNGEKGGLTVNGKPSTGNDSHHCRARCDLPGVFWGMASSGAGRQGVVTLGGTRRSNRFSAGVICTPALISPRGEKPPPRHPRCGAWRCGTPIYAIVNAGTMAALATIGVDGSPSNWFCQATISLLSHAG